MPPAVACTGATTGWYSSELGNRAEGDRGAGMGAGEKGHRAQGALKPGKRLFTMASAATRV